MFCNNCGKEVKDGSKFCNKCGAAIAADSAGADSIRPRKKQPLYIALIPVAALLVLGIAVGAFLWFSPTLPPETSNEQFAEAAPTPTPTLTPTPTPLPSPEQAAPTPTPPPSTPTETPTVVTPPPDSFSGDRIINVWSFSDEIPDAILRYKELNPGFDWEINVTVINDFAAYPGALEEALLNGGSGAPDIYSAEQAYVLRFTQGAWAGYAASYEELIPDFASKLSDAQVAQYAVDVGTRNGKVVGMRFQDTGSCLIYRRSIAADTWGTDDPATVASKVGPGWDKFLAGAADLKANGYYAVVGFGDVWQALCDGAAQGWVVNNKLIIDPAREYAFDFAKAMNDNKYWVGAYQWGDTWFAEMSQNRVFAYLGPAWLINYIVATNSGETYGDWAVTTSPVPWTSGGTWIIGHKDINSLEKKAAVGQLIEWFTLDTSVTGFQYCFANGILYDKPSVKDAVASKVVMEKSDGSLDLLAGQDMFDWFVPAGAAARADNWTEYDRYINDLFSEQVIQYYEGNKSKSAAIADFRQQVLDELGYE